MGSDGEFDIDPNAASTGAFGIDADGKFMVCGECCGGPSDAPCDDCPDAQPEATVTVTGCAVGDCTDAAGDYAFTSFQEDTNYCIWTLTHETDSDYQILIFWHKNQSYWEVDVYYVPSATTMFELDDTVNVECDTGDGGISGNASCAAGEDLTFFGGPDCTGCAAAVTITTP